MSDDPAHGLAVVPSPGAALLEALAQSPSPAQDLQHRALLATELSVCISDAQSPDNLLVWVNAAFERVTGYRAEDILGVNCRLLQGANPDRSVTSRISAAVREGRTVSETLLNYRADGSPFWNHVVISPMFDRAGRLTHHVGVQEDVTDAVGLQLDSARAHEQIRRANGRLRDLASVSAQFNAHIDLGDDLLGVIPRIVATQFGSWAIIAGLDERGAVASIDLAHADSIAAQGTGVAEALRSWVAAEPQGWHDVLPRMRRGPPLTFFLDRAQVHRFAHDLAPVAGAEPFRGLSIAATLLSARGRDIGVLAVTRDSGSGFDTDDLAAVADLGVRAAVALDNGRLYAREHRAAVTLQRSLLPQLPRLPDFDIAATYQPAESSAEVGGDWYDVLDLPSPGIGIAIGDVVGHDIRAAAAMGQLRSVLRSYAWAGDSPAGVIAQLDQLVRGLGMAAMATCFYATLKPVAPAGNHLLTYTSAGHPPVVLKRADGRIELLDQALTSPIGVDSGTGEIPQASVAFGPGDYLVLYTDGLVETRTRDIATGIAALVTTLGAAAPVTGAQALCDDIVAGLRHGQATEDDTCVLILRNDAALRTNG